MHGARDSRFISLFIDFASVFAVREMVVVIGLQVTLLSLRSYVTPRLNGSLNPRTPASQPPELFIYDMPAWRVLRICLGHCQLTDLPRVNANYGRFCT